MDGCRIPVPGITCLAPEGTRNAFPGPTVVVTHHAPSALSNPPQFAGSPISGAFYSNLDELIEDTKPTLWIHGHVHDSCDYVIGETRVVCNPFGYEGIETNVDWDPRAMVELPTIVTTPHLRKGKNENMD